MRLINTKTMLLEDFALRQVPQHYAILSHTWTEEEVSYQEYMDQTGETATKQGFSKILETCRLARGDQLDYVWIDTCCIDKTSSAELSEAINSMFRWYKDAWVCYAYLSDFPKISGVAATDLLDTTDLQSCRWFKRGWTLQELIAPSNMRFYDETWTCRGSKRALSNRIQQITNVHPGALADSSCLAALSIAEKMAWATGRETTRVEDMAYCLLGIFDINMPLLYGEGEKAYTRLQHEIIRHSNDLSIFGWSPSASPLGLEYRAGRRRACPPGCNHQARFIDRDYSNVHVLARYITEFGLMRDWEILNSTEHSVTNRGIKITCTLLEICLRGCSIQECRCCYACRTYVLPIGSQGSRRTMGVMLTKLGPDIFARAHRQLLHLDATHADALISSSIRPRSVYLLTGTTYHPPPGLFRLPLEIRTDTRCVIKSAAPEDRWDSSGRYWYVKDPDYDWGMVWLAFDEIGDVCVLFYEGLRCVTLDPRMYKREMVLVSTASTPLSRQDIYNLFDLQDKTRRDRNKKKGVESRINGTPSHLDWALEVSTRGSNSPE